MSLEVDTTELEIAFEDISRQEALDAANVAFSAANDRLLEAADEHDYDLFPLAQSAREPQWSEADGGYVFGWPHEAAVYFNEGTVDHKIEPVEADMLAFEWPDAPQEVREMFEDTFPLVFFPEVEVSGLPAIQYLEHGMQQAERHLGGEL